MLYQFYPSQLNIIIFPSQHPERRIGAPQQNPNLTPGRVQSSIKGWHCNKSEWPPLQLRLSLTCLTLDSRNMIQPADTNTIVSFDTSQLWNQTRQPSETMWLFHAATLLPLWTTSKLVDTNQQKKSVIDHISSSEREISCLHDRMRQGSAVQWRLYFFISFSAFCQ